VAGQTLLPVGHDLGAFHTGDGVTAPVQQIRLGAELVELSDAEFRLWSLAHGLPTGTDGQVVPTTEDELLAETDDPALVGSLVDRGLLAAADDAVRFASTHRLVPLALGLGNSPAEPWLFSVGLLNQPIVAMTGALFDMWQWAHLSPDLWLACQESAAVAERAGVDDPNQTDPARVLDGVLGSLHMLLSVRVACLDLRLGGAR
jgi:hypothetical protein